MRSSVLSIVTAAFDDHAPRRRAAAARLTWRIVTLFNAYSSSPSHDDDDDADGDNASIGLFSIVTLFNAYSSSPSRYDDDGDVEEDDNDRFPAF